MTRRTMSTPINIKLLFFGPLREIAGARQINLELDEVSLSDTVKRLLEQHPEMSSHKLLLAVNEEYAELNTQLKDGDEVAMFTAVSGG